jgi:hypothetical protein
LLRRWLKNAKSIVVYTVIRTRSTKAADAKPNKEKWSADDHRKRADCEDDRINDRPHKVDPSAYQPDTQPIAVPRPTPISTFSTM